MTSIRETGETEASTFSTFVKDAQLTDSAEVVTRGLCAPSFLEGQYVMAVTDCGGDPTTSTPAFLTGDIMRVVMTHPSGWLEVEAGFISPAWVETYKAPKHSTSPERPFPTVVPQTASSTAPLLEPVLEPLLSVGQPLVSQASAPLAVVTEVPMVPTAQLEELSVASGELPLGDLLTFVIKRKVGERIGLQIAGGAEVERKKKYRAIFVKRVYTGSAAGEQTQIQRGDRIVKVNEHDLTRSTHKAAVAVFESIGLEMTLVVSRIC